MTEKTAKNYLYELWQNGELPSNFTEYHSEYDTALEFTIRNGFYYLHAEQDQYDFL